MFRKCILAGVMLHLVAAGAHVRAKLTGGLYGYADVARPAVSGP